jgi:hypothetical protein
VEWQKGMCDLGFYGAAHLEINNGAMRTENNELKTTSGIQQI